MPCAHSKVTALSMGDNHEYEMAAKVEKVSLLSLLYYC